MGKEPIHHSILTHQLRQLGDIRLQWAIRKANYSRPSRATLSLVAAICFASSSVS
jgi:hypothetical protein